MNICWSLNIYVLTAFFGQVSSTLENCIGERCFTIPGSNETKNFDDSKKWCRDRNSTLAIVRDGATQEVLSQFLNSAQLNGQPDPLLFIDLQLQKQNANTWYLINGTPYLGGLREQNEINYWYYGYLKFYSNTNFNADGSVPNNLRNYICEFESTKCTITSTNYYIDKERCFIKYENESLSWYSAREKCRNNGGDLATFNTEPGTAIGEYEVPFNTSWLNSALSYWVGIRWKNWQWKSSDGGDEVIFSWWSSDEPNNYNNECVCVDPSGDVAWKWTDCSCTVSRQFICLKIVPTTIATTLITTRPTTKLHAVSFSFVNVTNSPLNALAIGLGAGFGGGVFLILLVIIAVVAAILTRKRRRNKNGVESQHKTENKRSTITPNFELTTSNRSDVYAEVVPTTQHPANNKPQNDVIYAQPDFSNNPNSASAGSDPSNTRQGKVKSIMLDESNDLYANSASVS